MQHALLFSVAQSAFVLCERWVSVADVNRSVDVLSPLPLLGVVGERGAERAKNFFKVDSESDPLLPVSYAVRFYFTRDAFGEVVGDAVNGNVRELTWTAVFGLALLPLGSPALISRVREVCRPYDCGFFIVCLAPFLLEYAAAIYGWGVRGRVIPFLDCRD